LHIATVSTSDGGVKRGPAVPARQPVARWVRESRAGLVGLAVLIGAGAVAFRWLITTFTHLFSGHEDYSAAGRVAHP
jgi:CIC family chloride channel protein